MHSPKKKYQIKLNNDSSRIIHYGGNELADAQDLLGRPVVNIFWEFMGAAESDDVEVRGKRLLEILGDKEILILLHMGIRGGTKDGGKEFSMKAVGDLIYTDIARKSEYIDAIIGSLSIAIFGKSPDDLAEEAKAKEKEKDTEDDSEEEALPNPT